MMKEKLDAGGTVCAKSKSDGTRALCATEQYTATPLSRSAEQELGWAIINDNCHESREKMILANLHLVSNVACRYAGRGVSLGELVERGRAGLIRAVEHYDPAQGMRFSTPARWWIKQAIRQALFSPVSQASACRRLEEAAVGFGAPGAVRNRAEAAALRSESNPRRAEVRGARSLSSLLKTQCEG